MTTNPLDALYNATPQISDSDRLDLLDESEAQSEDTGQAPQAEQPIEDASTEGLTDKERFDKNIDEGKSFGEASMDNWANQKPGWDNPSAYPAAAGAGVVDFGIGLVNKVIPGTERDLPHLPQYQHEGLQAVRDISSLVVPTLYISRFLGGKAVAADKSLKWKLGQDKFVQWLSKTGLNVGVGVAVDEIAPVQERDHNAAGWLKKSWPKTWGWVPDNWATLDTDSPETKRLKNRNEGAAMGFLSDLVPTIGRLFKGRAKLKQATNWVPQNEKGANWLKSKGKEVKLSSDPVENDLLKSAKRRYDELTELGQSKIDDGVDLTQPQLGVHDAFDYSEEAIRSSDEGGIVAAGIDQVRIVKQIDTRYGRLANIFSPKTLREVLSGKQKPMDLMKDLGKTLKETEVNYKGSKCQVAKHSDSLAEAERLGAALYDTDLEGMKEILRPLSTVDALTGARKLSKQASKGVIQAIKKYSDDFINIDTVRAQGLTATSLSGQISDIAESSRLMNGSPAMGRAEELVLDRIEFLMNLQGQTLHVSRTATNINDILNRIKRAGDELLGTNAAKTINEETNRTLQALERIANESKQTIETLRLVKEQRPQMLGPLMLAYEVTDGKVKSMSALNTYIRNTTGTVSKAFFDARADMPSAWVQGVWGNIYNSVLSAVGTPLKAALSNTVLMIERPLATFAGAIQFQDWETLKRAHYMYNIGMGETLTRSWNHMNQVFKRASVDPASVGYIMRDDIARQNARQVELLRTFSDAAEVEGNFGPSIMTNQIEALNDLSDHPALRFSANAMSAFDGFTRSFIGNIEARGRAYDKIMGSGGRITSKRVRAMAREVYGEMFDETGMITDSAVEYASKEIAMNLDNNAVAAVNELVKTVPAVKPFLMFPKTSINMMRFAGSHSPLGTFVDDLNAFSLPFNQMDEVKIDELLSSRGVSLRGNKQAAYETIRAELKGRKAIGTLAVGTAAMLFTTDRLRGNGIYDKTRQRTRRELGWKPKTYKGLDGKWYSYDNLGPITDWLSLTADIMDNFDTLDEPTLELLLNKAGFVLSANLTDKTFTAGLEPLGDVLAGNPAAAARWAGSFGSALLPGSGFRNEFARLITPQLKEVNQELEQIIANRNPGLKGQLPDLYDWMDGSKVGEPMSFWTRAWNTYSPLWKSSEAITPEKQFLIDIEFDGRPSLTTNGRGVEYSPEQRSEITRIIGEEKLFANEVKRIMKSKTGQQFRKQWYDAANKGVYMDRKIMGQIQLDLRKALRTAQSIAEMRLSTREQVFQQRLKEERIERATKVEDINEILNLQRN